MPDGIHGVEWLARTRDDRDLAAWLALMPYARRIGVSAQPDARGEGLLFRLDPRPGNVGNVMLPALHGGVVAAFMETAATLDLMLAAREPRRGHRGGGILLPGGDRDIGQAPSLAQQFAAGEGGHQP